MECDRKSSVVVAKVGCVDDTQAAVCSRYCRGNFCSLKRAHLSVQNAQNKRDHIEGAVARKSGIPDGSERLAAVYTAILGFGFGFALVGLSEVDCSQVSVEVVAGSARHSRACQASTLVRVHSQLANQASFVPCIRKYGHCDCTTHRKDDLGHTLPCAVYRARTIPT